jgi:ABC-type branched-subunit amino acid transport system substrate-binding protein
MGIMGKKLRKHFGILISVLALVLIFGCLPEKRRVYIKKPKPPTPAVKEEPEKLEPKVLVPPEKIPEDEVIIGEAKEEEEEEEEYEFIEYRWAEDLFFSAVKRYDEELYNTSFILFDQLIRQFPDDSLVEDSIVYQGRLLFIKELYENAIEKFEYIKYTFPDTRFKEEADYYIYLCLKNLGSDKAKEKREEFFLFYPEGKFLPEVTLDVANEYLMDEEHVLSVKEYVKYYNLSDNEQTKADVYVTVLDIVENILMLDELESLSEIYYDKFPAAFIKLSLADSYLYAKDVESAKFTLLEIEEFFPTFEKLDKVHEYLERIELRVKTKADVIACLLPLSGKYEAYGRRLLAGVLFAADVFNESEPEHPITIMVKDTKGDPDTALKMLDEAYNEDQAIAAIGPLLSKNAQICADRAEELKFPIMLLTQKENVTKGYDYVYRKFITNSKQVSSLVDYAMFDKGFSRFAIMYPKSTYGEELKELFFNEVIRLGGNIAAVESYGLEDSDFSNEIKKIVGRADLTERKRLRALWIEEVIEEEAQYMQQRMEKGEVTGLGVQKYLDALEKELMEEEYRPVVDFQAIFVPDKYSRAGLIIPQLLYHDIDKDVLKLGTNSYNSKKLIDIARDNANGVVFVDGFFKDSDDKEIKRFVKEYEEIFKTIPTLLEAESYDSAKIIIGLLREKNVLDREVLKEALDTLKDYKGVTGHVKSFNDGDADEDLTLLTVRREKIKEFKRSLKNEYILHSLDRKKNRKAADN